MKTNEGKSQISSTTTDLFIIHSLAIVFEIAKWNLITLLQARY